MKRRPLLGSHLYGQIVVPLLVAAVAVGILATFIAVFFLEHLTDRWVAQVAEGFTSNIGYGLVNQARNIERDSRTTVRLPSLRSAATKDQLEKLRAEVVVQKTLMGIDGVLVLDDEGRVVASSGVPTTQYGDKPLGDTRTANFGQPWTAFTRVGGEYALVSTRRITQSEGAYSLAIVRYIDDQLLATLGVSAGNAFCLYDEDGGWIARAVGSGLSGATTEALAESFTGPDPDVVRALEQARADGQGSGRLKAGDHDFQLYSRRVALPGLSGATGGVYVVGAVSRDVSTQAGATTRNLIAMWSVVAVVALVGLGGWVARRVSDPLVELAASARRIADGDFTTRVMVKSTNEIGELADSFNDMTDSLRERSESLTKKVLELATLYEMSRALGSTLDMEELLGSVLDSALRIFDLDLGYVVLRDRDTEVLAVRAIRGVQGRSTDSAVRSSMSEWVVREGRPLIFNPEAGSSGEQIDAVTGAKAALCVPLVSAEGTVGSITIGSTDSTYRFNSDDVRLLSTIANHVTIAVGNIELFTSLQEAYLATVRSLAAAVDAKDSYTRGHSDYVAKYATMIAEKMEMSQDQRIALEMAAYLHDIGKIGIAEEILLKPGRLEDDEMEQMRHHPLIGANILKPVAFPWAITPVVRHHHEAWDGGGYPARLKGEEIPVLARILTVADSFEAMTSDRPYRKGRSEREAVEELQRCSGSQFDPRIVEVFSAIISEQSVIGVVDGIDLDEDVAPEEVRAIFAVLIDGVLLSFRKLGGPRLSQNVENEIGEYFSAQHLPFRIARGRVAFSADPPATGDGELVEMRSALRQLDGVIGRLSGVTLVDHFYADAAEALSARMRALARDLGLYRG